MAGKKKVQPKKKAAAKTGAKKVAKKSTKDSLAMKQQVVHF